LLLLLLDLLLPTIESMEKPRRLLFFVVVVAAAATANKLAVERAVSVAERIEVGDGRSPVIAAEFNMCRECGDGGGGGEAVAT
jgi:hypothetical protein